MVTSRLKLRKPKTMKCDMDEVTNSTAIYKKSWPLLLRFCKSLKVWMNRTTWIERMYNYQGKASSLQQPLDTFTTSPLNSLLFCQTRNVCHAARTCLQCYRRLRQRALHMCRGRSGMGARSIVGTTCQVREGSYFRLSRLLLLQI